MISFRDLFGFKRRVLPRVAVGWRVDVQVPNREGYSSFYTRDIGVNGVRLVGNPRDAFARKLMHSKRVDMRLQFPSPLGLVDVEGELRWESEEGGSVQIGFKFTRIGQEVRQTIGNYIETNPEDIIKGSL